MDITLYAILKNKITEIRQKLLNVVEDATDMNSRIEKNTNNIEKKLDKNQGASNSGKITGINESGDIVPMFPQGVTYNENTQCLEYGADEKLNLNAGIQLDDTLSKVGYAADAASVGKLKTDLDTLNEGGLILKEDFIGTQVNEWLDEHPEATTTVQDKSLETSKFTDNAKLYVMKDYVTPQMYGAVGDGVNDDTQALQSCLNSDNKLKVLTKKYRITEPLIISGNYVVVDGYNSEIVYEGNESAVIIKKCCDSDIKLGKITSANGNGIEIQCLTSNDWSQYTDIHFKCINSLDKAICFNTTDGWTNEIRIFGGKLESGNYGIYADAHNKDAINNITVQNVGIEGVLTGFYLANSVSSWNILNPRYHEAYETLFETVGNVKNISFYGSGFFYYNSRCNFSSNTYMAIYAPITENGGAVIDNFGCYILSGCVVPITFRSYRNLVNTTNAVVGKNEFHNYFYGGNVSTLKLNKAYGRDCGVNEFYYHNGSDNSDVTIYDAYDNVITSSMEPWAKYRFVFISGGVGWQKFKV